jgi:hypothetical protein
MCSLLVVRCFCLLVVRCYSCQYFNSRPPAVAAVVVSVSYFLEGQVSSTRNICLCRRNLYNIYILFSYLLLAVDKLLVILMMMVMMMVVCQKCAAVVGASRLIICHFLMLFIIECEYCRISN